MKFECYEECSFHETFLPDSLRLCGNHSFVLCLVKKTDCKNDYKSCLYKQTQDSVIGIDVTIVVVSALACLTVLVVVFVFYYRFFNHTSVTRNRKDELELKKTRNHNFNDSVNIICTSQKAVEEGNHQTNFETEIKSVWSNLYITKLQDYETTDEEDEYVHCSVDEDNSNMF